MSVGINVKTEAGKKAENVWSINWREPGKNEFAIAGEVTAEVIKRQKKAISSCARTSPENFTPVRSMVTSITSLGMPYRIVALFAGLNKHLNAQT